MSAAEQDEVADPRARREQHQTAQQRHQRGHREVGLEQDEQRYHAEHQDERHHAPLELAHLHALLRREHGAPDHHRESRQLRRLEVERADVHPPTGPVQRRGDVPGERQEGNEQEADGDDQQRPRPRPPAIVVLPRGPEQQEPAEDARRSAAAPRSRGPRSRRARSPGSRRRRWRRRRTPAGRA